MKESVVVKKGGLFNKYRTIQQGIDAVLDGGTVYIESGNYEENLFLEGKDITLIGKGQVMLSGTENHPLITTVDTNLSLQGISFQQAGHTNTIYVKETSEVEIADCKIEGENYQDVKTTYPALWVGLESTVRVKNSTLIGHTSDSVYCKESTVILENCDIKGVGVYADLHSKLRARKIRIKNPSSHGIFVKEAELDLQEMNMTGGGVAVILQDSKGYIHTMTTNHTYRDVLRVDNSELIVEKAEMKNFSEIKKTDEKSGYPAVYIKNRSVVKLNDVHIHDSLFDGIQVYQSQLDLSNAVMKKLFMGIYIREQSVVSLEDVEMHQLEYNAVSAANQSSVTIKNSLFDHCVEEHEKNYPVIFIKEQGNLHVEGTTIKGSLHDAIYLDEVQNTYMEDVTFDAVNTGVYIQKSVLNANQLKIKNCYKNALILQDSAADIRNSFLENNNLDSSPSYEANSDIPKAVNAAISITNAKVALTRVEVIDKTSSISLQDQANLNADLLQLSGGIFSMSSTMDISQLTFRNIEKEAVHFKLLRGTHANVQFYDPGVRILLAKDRGSQFQSNLLHSPNRILQHDFAGKPSNSHPVREVIPFKKDKEEIPPKDKESVQVEKLIGPMDYKESMKKLLTEIALYKVRSAQGIAMDYKWGIQWIQKGMDDLTPFFQQTKKLLIEAGFIQEAESYRLSALSSLTELNHKNNGLLWVDQLDGIKENASLMAFLENKLMNREQEWIIILSGSEADIYLLQYDVPNLMGNFHYKTVFDFYTAEEVAEIVRQTLVEHQFVFDSSFLKESVINHYPVTADERTNRWPEEIVKAIIQVQSDRLLQEADLSLEKEQIISLTQTDILKGVTAAK